MVQDASGEMLRLEAVVEAVEPVGAESFLYCSGTVGKTIMRVPDRTATDPGAAITIAVPPSKLHFFDGNGKRV